MSLGSCRCVLPNPHPVAIWILEAKLSVAVKSDRQVGHIQSVPSHLLVILHYLQEMMIKPATELKAAAAAWRNQRPVVFGQSSMPGWIR